MHSKMNTRRSYAFDFDNNDKGGIGIRCFKVFMKKEEK